MKSKRLGKKIQYYIIAFLGILFLISGLLYFIIIHRFKESVKFIVHNQTDGKYMFDAGRAKVSLWSKSLMLEKSMLICKDTSKANSYYNVKLSKLKFSLTSWNALLFKNKILVDNLEIINPDVEVYSNPKKRLKNKTGFRPSDILSFLEKTQQSFNLSNLSIKNASISFKQQNKKSVTLKHINLSIRNFVKVNNDDSHLLGSDHINLSVGKQSIAFPDRNLTVSFSSLRFNSKNQYFNVDSLLIDQQDGHKNGRMEFKADRFSFNSKHLPAAYQKEELLLDTVRCTNPVMTLYDHQNKLKKSSAKNKKVKNEIFKLINIKFFEIENASVVQKKPDGTLKNSAGKTANLTVYNLSLRPSKDPKITLDSVHLNMEKIAFFSKDSLHKLTIEEFSFKNNDIIFHHVNYRPTTQQKIQKPMVFSAPSLILRNVNLEALLKKKLVADQAELLKPLIIIDDRKRIITKNHQSKTSPKDKKNMGLFMTLHQMKQMINVDQLVISGGTINYKGSSKSNIVLHAKKLNAKIILNRTLSSDSLVDIKHSIHKLEIGDIHLKSNKFLLNLRNYKFAGLNRQNWAENLKFQQNKNSVEAKNVYWKAFDWDLFQKSKIIKVDSLYINRLISDVNNPPKTVASRHKDLPDIRVDNLRIDKFLFNRKTATNQIGFSANNILLTNVRSHAHYFTWRDISLNISNFRLLGENTKGNIANIYVKNNLGSIQDVRFISNSDKEFQKLFLPTLFFSGKFNSTQPDILAFESVSVDNGHIEVQSKEKNNSKSFHAPKIPFHIKSLSINNLKISYIKEKEKDSLKYNGTVNLAAQNIRSFNESSHMIKSDDLRISVLDSNVDSEKFNLTIPQLSLQLKGGNLFRKNDLMTLSSTLSLNWSDASFKFQKDSMRLQANNNSGSYIDNEFILSGKNKFDPKRIIKKANFKGGQIVYRDAAIMADIQNYGWNSLKNTFHLTNFSLHPVLSREIFFKNSKYQDDYLELKGDSASVSVAKAGSLSSDSAFSLSKISLDGVHLIVSRDKTLPRKPAKHKLMPTQLISSIKQPFSIDTISLKNNSVVYKEFEVKSKAWSEIPFSSLNGNIMNLSNQAGRKDSLELNLSGNLFKADINRFSYKESYVDSLAGFVANVHFSAIDLKDFSNVSRPMGSLDISSGYADNLYSGWSGNQYAATGSMKFSYDHLTVKFLNPEGKKGWHFSSKMKTFAANLLIPNSHHKSAMMFVERDPNKFVFNYWIKMQLSGIMSTFGLKSDKKYLKTFNKNYERYGLPRINPTTSKE
jgi:hypothetical protein